MATVTRLAHQRRGRRHGQGEHRIVHGQVHGVGHGGQPFRGPDLGTASTQTCCRPGRMNTAVLRGGPSASRNRAPASERPAADIGVRRHFLVPAQHRGLEGGRPAHPQRIPGRGALGQLHPQAADRGRMRCLGGRRRRIGGRPGATPPPGPDRRPAPGARRPTAAAARPGRRPTRGNGVFPRRTGGKEGSRYRFLAFPWPKQIPCQEKTARSSKPSRPPAEKNIARRLP